MALTKDEIAALKSLAAIAPVLVAQASAPTGAPVTPAAASPLVAARKGERLRRTRQANIGKPGFSCDGHGTHAAHGFAFRKDVCPTDKQPL